MISITAVTARFSDRRVGYGMIVVGVVVLAALGSYIGYGAYGRSNLDDLNFNVEEVEQLTVARPVGNSTDEDADQPLVGLTEPTNLVEPEVAVGNGVDAGPLNGDDVTLALEESPADVPQATLASTDGLARRYATAARHFRYNGVRRISAPVPTKIIEFRSTPSR